MPRRTSLEVKFGAKVKLGPIMELAKSLHAQGEAAFSAGDEYGGLALMRQAVDVLEQSSDKPGFNAEAHLLLCSIRSDVGDALRKLARWGEARAHLERVLIEAAEAPPKEHGTLVARARGRLGALDEQEQEQRELVMSPKLQRAWRRRAQKARAALRLQAAARRRSSQRLAGDLRDARSAVEVQRLARGRSARRLAAAQRQAQTAVQRVEAAAHADAADSHRAATLVRLLRELEEATADENVWLRLRVDGNLAWDLRRICVQLTAGIASLSAAVGEAGPNPDDAKSARLAEARQLQREMRGVVYVQDKKTEYFYKKVYCHVDDDALTWFVVDTLASEGTAAPVASLDARPTRVPFASIARCRISSLERYEFELRLVPEAEGAPLRVLSFRADTWRSLHHWVNGILTLRSLSRQGFFGAGARGGREGSRAALSQISSHPYMGKWARDQVAAGVDASPAQRASAPAPAAAAARPSAVSAGGVEYGTGGLWLPPMMPVSPPPAKASPPAARSSTSSSINVAAAVLSPQELARKAANPAFAASLARAAAAQGVHA